MTEAEQALLQAVLNSESSRDYPPREGSVAQAAQAVLLERASPEAREKFVYLYDVATKAERAFHEFSRSLPGPVTRKWLTEMETASRNRDREREQASGA